MLFDLIYKFAFTDCNFHSQKSLSKTYWFVA